MEVGLIQVFFSVFKLIGSAVPDLYLFFEAEDSFCRGLQVIVQMVEYRAGDADIEGAKAFVANGLGFFDGFAEPHEVLVVVAVDGQGAENGADIDAHGEIDVSVLLDKLFQGVADQVSRLQGSVDYMGDAVLVFGVDQQETIRSVAAQEGARLLGDFLKRMVIDLIDSGSKSFSRLQQHLCVFHLKVTDGCLQDDGAAVGIQRVDIVKIARLGIAEIAIRQLGDFGQ